MNRHIDAHADLHSEQGARRGEHPAGRRTRSSRCTISRGWNSRNPTSTGPKCSLTPSDSPPPHGPEMNCSYGEPTLERRA